jgi:hypothetical protein
MSRSVILNAVTVAASATQVAEQPSPAVLLPSSQVSGAVVTPSPQRAVQSLSLPIVAPVGQHPSPLVGVVMAVKRHTAVHVPALASMSLVQAIPSEHVEGQLPVPDAIAVSHVSGAVRTPSPQTRGQSLSVPIVAPDGQQPSPFAGAEIGVEVHAAAHVPPPVSVSRVHAMPSLQALGQRPGIPAGIAVSQFSPA